MATEKAIVAVMLQTESSDTYLYLYDEVDGPDEFAELISKDMGEELAYVWNWELRVMYGNLNYYEEALRAAIQEAEEE